MVMVVNSAVAMAGAAAKTNASRSGLQKQVLALYKRALRAAQHKDRELAAAASSGTTAVSSKTSSTAAKPNTRDTFLYVRERFRDDAASVRRTDFNVIEHLLRKGERDLQMLARMKAAHFAHVPHFGTLPARVLLSAAHSDAADTDLQQSLPIAAVLAGMLVFVLAGVVVNRARHRKATKYKTIGDGGDSNEDERETHSYALFSE